MESERELVAALRRGDEAAFDAVYDSFRPRIYGFLVRLAGRKDVAEDLLQETFLRLAASASRLREDTNLRAWLFTVARNVHVSHRRTLVIDLDRLEGLRLFGDDAAPVPTPFEEAAGSQMERRLEAAIQRLPAKYREVILLVGVERMTPTEAAEILKLRPDAMRQRLSRARGMIKAELEVSDG